MMKKNNLLTFSLAIIALLWIASCASNPVSKNRKEFSSGMSETRENLGSTAVDTALTPLSDLNLRRDKIPRVLRKIKDPYAMPSPDSCHNLRAQLNDLNTILGSDYDDPRIKESLARRTGRAATSGAVDAVQSEIQGLIPMRDVIRYASGATRHEKNFANAIDKGQHRRAFLKGVMKSKKCAIPQYMPPLKK